MHSKTLEQNFFGPRSPTRLNLLLGFNQDRDRSIEYEKLELFSQDRYCIDFIADLSLHHVKREDNLWYRVINQTNCYAATVPVYFAVGTSGALCERNLLEIIEEHAESGVAIITIHCTPTYQMLKLAENRIIPITSRGGGMVIRDMFVGKRIENIFVSIIDEIIEICSRCNTTISLGSTFRSGSIVDALDNVYMEELKHQISLAQYIRNKKCKVIIETPGHISARGIHKLCDILNQHSFSIMPLGPMPTDIAKSEDDTAAVIGAGIMGSKGCADIISIVTSEEHLGGIPGKASIERAIRKYIVLKHIIDIDKIGYADMDSEISLKRHLMHNCNSSIRTYCTRCGDFCPLRLEY